jgi:hypothetical protein
VARKGRPWAQAERLWLSHYYGLTEQKIEECKGDLGIPIDWKTMLQEALVNVDEQLQRARSHHISIVETLKFGNADELWR